MCFGLCVAMGLCCGCSVVSIPQLPYCVHQFCVKSLIHFSVYTLLCLSIFTKSCWLFHAYLSFVFSTFFFYIAVLMFSGFDLGLLYYFTIMDYSCLMFDICLNVHINPFLPWKEKFIWVPMSEPKMVGSLMSLLIYEAYISHS